MSATSRILNTAVQEKNVEDLKKVLAQGREPEKTGLWNWIKRVARKLPVQFIKVMLRVLKEFLRTEVRTLAFDLFGRASELQKEIVLGNMTPEEAGLKLRSDAKEISPQALKKSDFIINLLCEIAVFAVKLISK